MSATPYKIISFSELFDAIDFDEPINCDTETCGFYQRVRLLQVYQASWAEVLMVEWPDPWELIVLFNKCNSRWHNSHYDITTIQQQTQTRWCPERFDDTFLLARLACPAKEHFSLDAVMTYAIGYDPYVRAGLNKTVLQKSNWNTVVLTKSQLQYAATDVYYMPQVWDMVKGKVDDPSYKLDMSTLRTCLDFQWNGMPVDDTRSNAKASALIAEITEKDPPINVNSWQQVRPFIGEEQSDDLALAQFAGQGNERAALVRLVRKLKKRLSFLKKFDTQDGRIYGKFKPSARSGRLTSNDQNLQQLPRALKDVFGYPEGSDRVLIYSDYAQIELRTICAITVCREMERLFRSGEDLHGYTAEMIFGKTWTKFHRQLSKTYNFNLLYGGGIAMLIGILVKTADVWISESQANKDRNKWRNLWREIFAWQQRGIAAHKAGKLGSTALGRKYRATRVTDQLNIENQGSAAEVAKLALHYFEPIRASKYSRVKIINFIHDSFILDSPNEPELYQACAIELARCMQDAWFEMSKLFNIKDLPMPVDVAVGYNWGDIESDEPDLWNYQLPPYEMFKNEL